MSVDVEELLRETPAPAMSLSPASVLNAAKRDVVRRRRRFAGLATAGIAAAAAIALTVGVVGREESTSRPMPAQTVTQNNSSFQSDSLRASFFRRSDGLPVGQVRSTAIPVTSSDGTGMTPETLYAVSTQDGVLRLSRVEGTQQVLLPLVAKLSGGGSMTTDRGQSLVVRPLPADVRQAQEVFADGGYSEGSGLTMPDGSTAGVFWLGETVPASDAGFSWWHTTSGALGSSTGEAAKTVTISTGGRKATYWEFTKSALCGTDEDGGSSQGPMTNGQCDDLGGASGSSSGGTTTYRFEQLWTVNGPIRDVTATPRSGVTGAALETAQIPGTSRWIIWTTGNGTSTDTGNTPYQWVSWIGPDGPHHTN